MIKVLWVCNIMLPELADEFGVKNRINTAGWLSGVWNGLLNQSDIALTICVPIYNPAKFKDGKTDKYYYYSFLYDSGITQYDSQVERFDTIVKEVKPDVVHIWGTEYTHSMALMEACEKNKLANKVLVSIQGIVQKTADVYLQGLSEAVYTAKTKSGISIWDEQQLLIQKAPYEKTLIEKASYITGRTQWDKSWVKELNPSANYIHCGEILRTEIYEAPKWDCHNCRKHSVFISQAYYPIKGLHTILEAVSKLSQSYEDLRVYVAGNSIIDSEEPYAVYLREQLEKYGLQNVFEFVGILSAGEIAEYYKKCNVFLSPSIIENSSNSICEAMRIGTPVIASDVGGTASLIENGISGLLYGDQNRNAQVVDYIKQVFDNTDLAMRLSKNEISRSEQLNCKEEIINTMLKIYNTIAEE